MVFLRLWNQVCNARSTNDLEAIACDIVDKVCALNFDVLYRRGKCCAEQEASTYWTERLLKSVTRDSALKGSNLTRSIVEMNGELLL